MKQKTFFKLLVIMILLTIFNLSASPTAYAQSNANTNKQIELRLKGLCKALTKDFDSQQYESKSFKSLQTRVRDAEQKYGDIFWNFDIYLDAQDCGTVTLHSYKVLSVKGNTAKVRVVFKDSDFGLRPTIILVMVYENNNWFVNDVIFTDGSSWRNECNKFIKNGYN